MRQISWMRAAAVAAGALVAYAGCAEELLYNGIVLPQVWPPRTVDAKDVAPMAVPYLANPPAVIPIDVGRQLFVDDFLVATSTLTRVFHKPEKYAGNPVLKPETPLELNGAFDDSAVVKGGGLWWDTSDEIFKLWYEAGWLMTLAPFTLENCRPVTADSTLEPVTWCGADDLSALRGKPVRFRFSLRQGALFAFWVSRDETGRSDGYVAGGGPGFTGLTDTVGRAELEAERALATAR
jgi:hypothetical protein